MSENSSSSLGNGNSLSNTNASHIAGSSTGVPAGGANASNSGILSRDSRDPNMASMLQQAQLQGRRLPFGAMSRRRSSLGMAEAALGDLFGRRASGFGELDVLGRRGSLDSTSAVLDAAIMDLTRRRLSMAMGPMPGDSLMPETFPSVAGAYGSSGMDLTSSFGAGGMNSLGSNPNALTGGISSQVQNSAPAEAGDAENSSTETNRQQQLQEQQRDLERRQKELELQRQQLVAAMEERRRVMQQMQQKMGQVPGGTSVQRNSLLGSFGGGLGTSLGGLSGSLSQGLGGGLGSTLGGGLGGGLGLGASVGGSLSGGLGSAGMGASNFRKASLGGNTSNLLLGLGGRGVGQTGSLMPGLEEAVRRTSMGLGISPRRSSLDLLVGTLDRPEFAARLAAPTSKHDLVGRADALSTALADRRFSLTGDLPPAQPNQVASTSAGASNGPFAMMNEPLPLAMDCDKDWLTPLHCFVRRHCVEVFTATEKDVSTPSKGKRKPIQVGQVGIRCPHCHHEETDGARERGSVYYPTSIASIYNATMNLLQRHLHNCNSVPPDVMRRYETLKADDARSGTSKKYWVESALSLGLVDTPQGIRFSALPPPPLPGISRQQLSTGNYSGARRNSNEFFSTSSNALVDVSQNSHGLDLQSTVDLSGDSLKLSSTAASKRGQNSMSQQGQFPEDGAKDQEAAMSKSAPLVTPADEPYATSFSYHLLLQMQPCVFTEADRLGKRKGLPPGFPGLACRHCFGGYGSGRFFPSSIKTLSDTSKTLNVLHNHMMRCRKCPPEVRETLAALRKHHDEQRAKMKFGSQKAFFARIWDRLHYKDPNVTAKRKFKATKETATFPPQSVVGLDPSMQPTPFDAALAMQQYGGVLNKKPKL